MSSLDRPRFSSEAVPALPADVVQRLLSPNLVVWMATVRSNLRGMREFLGGDVARWRPHVKTAKIPAVFAEYVALGIRSFKCCTTREAHELLVACTAAGAAEVDVIVAYPHVGPALERLARIARQNARHRLSVLCEDPSAVATIPAELGLWVDVNPGMHRTGVPLAEEERIVAIARAAGERFRGIHFYEGHLHDEDVEAREQEAFALYDRLVALRGKVHSAGALEPELVTSGTPAFPHAIRYPAFRDPALRHQISPGTVVFHDVRSAELLPQIDFLRPAAHVFSRIISHPRPGHYTLDAGSKSLAAEQPGPAGEILGRGADRALTPSEEHLPVQAEDALPPRGSHVFIVPRHVCPTVNLAERVLCIEPDGSVRVESVAARAHELWADESGGSGGG